MADWNQRSPVQGSPGSQDCEQCHGAGVIPVPGIFPPRLRQCVCTHVREIAINVERGWPGLIRAPKLPKGKRPVLKGKLTRDLRICAPLTWFRTQMRWAAVRRPPNWSFKVVSDVDLMRAWLGSVSLKGMDLIDPDAAAVSLQHLTLVDLIEPPGLLVIRLGVKTAANKEMANVLLETLYHRSHLGKPTWLYHDPTNPFDETMRSYSLEAALFIKHWEYIEKRPPRKRRALGARPNTPLNPAGLQQAEDLIEEDVDLSAALDASSDAVEPAYTEDTEEDSEEAVSVEGGEEGIDEDEFEDGEEEPDEEETGSAPRRGRRTMSTGLGSSTTVAPTVKRSPPKNAWKKK